MKCFAIKFKNGCYFITSADDPKTVVNDFMRKGHEPIAVESVIDNAESYHEWALFRDYLGLYGLERVRGASYTEWLLTDVQRQALIEYKNSWSPITQDKTDDIMDSLVSNLNRITVDEVVCKRCGGDGHKSKECYASHDINDEIIMDEESYSDFED